MHITAGVADYIRSIDVPFFPRLTSARYEIADTIATMMHRIPREYRMFGSLVIVYGSPWSHTLPMSAAATKEHHEKPIPVFINELLQKKHTTTKIHGATYTAEKGMIAVSVHPVGYNINGHLTAEIPTGKFAAAETLCAVDWVDTELHKSVVAALYPGYLQSTQLVLCSLEGIMLSRYAGELSQHYDALVVIGSNSTQIIRHQHTSTDINQFSVPLGYVAAAIKSDIITSDHITDEYCAAYHDALYVGLGHLFPEVLVRPRILIVYEPHSAALVLARAIAARDTQHDAIHPIWTVAPEQTTAQWMQALVEHLIV